jgi:hypothetical protein
MDAAEWEVLLPVVQAILNNTESPRLLGETPLSVFTKLKGTNPINLVMRECHFEEVEKAEIRVRIEETLKKETENLQNTLEQEKLINMNISKMREQNKKRSEKNSMGTFENGDFVLILKTKKGPKLHSKFAGPYRVMEKVHDFVYQLQHIQHQTVETVHCNRMISFMDKEYDATSAMKEQAAFITDHGYQVESISACRFNKQKKRWELEVEWEGFEPTWEDFKKIMEDVPKLVQKFIRENRDQDIVKKLKKEEKAV